MSLTSEHLEAVPARPHDVAEAKPPATYLPDQSGQLPLFGPEPADPGEVLKFPLRAIVDFDVVGLRAADEPDTPVSSVALYNRSGDRVESRPILEITADMAPDQLWSLVAAIVALRGKVAVRWDMQHAAHTPAAIIADHSDFDLVDHGPADSAKVQK